MESPVVTENVERRVRTGMQDQATEMEATLAVARAVLGGE